MFRVDVLEEGPALLLQLQGELDSHACADLEAALDGQLDGVVRSVSIDAADLTFLDSSGLRELLRLRQRVAGAGGAVHFSAISTQVRRVLEITDLLGEFGQA